VTHDSNNKYINAWDTHCTMFFYKVLILNGKLSGMKTLQARFTEDIQGKFRK
jgi:hypothetical protein